MIGFAATEITLKICFLLTCRPDLQIALWYELGNIYRGLYFHRKAAADRFIPDVSSMYLQKAMLYLKRAITVFQSDETIVWDLNGIDKGCFTSLFASTETVAARVDRANQVTDIRKPELMNEFKCQCPIIESEPDERRHVFYTRLVDRSSKYKSKKK